MVIDSPIKFFLIFWPWCFIAIIVILLYLNRELIRSIIFILKTVKITKINDEMVGIEPKESTFFESLQTEKVLDEDDLECTNQLAQTIIEQQLQELLRNHSVSYDSDALDWLYEMIDRFQDSIQNEAILETIRSDNTTVSLDFMKQAAVVICESDMSFLYKD